MSLIFDFEIQISFSNFNFGIDFLIFIWYNYDTKIRKEKEKMYFKYKGRSPTLNLTGEIHYKDKRRLCLSLLLSSNRGLHLRRSSVNFNTSR